MVPSASFLQRQIQAGVFQKLDKSLLPNLKNLDPDITHSIQVYDPGNQYSVNYLWGTSGVGYNEDQIAQAMPNAPVDSFAMFYDPNVVRNFQKCGVSILDAPDEMVGTVLIYLGKRSEQRDRSEDLKAAEKVLLSIRPYIRYINSSKYIDDLANGELCLALGWSGDVGQARRAPRKRARASDQIQHRQGGRHHVLRHAGDSCRCAASEQRAPVHQLSAAPRRGGEEFQLRCTMPRPTPPPSV